MREYLLSYKEQGKTILICFHSAEDISVLCDTVHEMDKGVISRIRVLVNLLFTGVTPPSGASDRKVMWVQVPSSAPRKARFYRAFFFCSSKNKWADALALRTVFN